MMTIRQRDGERDEGERDYMVVFLFLFCFTTEVMLCKCRISSDGPLCQEKYDTVLYD